MAHPKSIGTHHALMGITMVVFAIGASAFGPQLLTNAASDPSNAKQRDAFVVACKDAHLDKLSSALAAATSHPGVRRALEGYWKEVKECVVREAKHARTGSGSDLPQGKAIQKGRLGSGSVLSDEMRKKAEEIRNKQPTSSSQPAPSPQGGERKEKPEFKFRNSAPHTPGEAPKPKPTHNGKDEI